MPISALKPCPFCGETPHEINVSGSFDGWSGTIRCMGKRCDVKPSCTSSTGRGSKGAERGAIEIWNKRK